MLPRNFHLLFEEVTFNAAGRKLRGHKTDKDTRCRHVHDLDNGEKIDVDTGQVTFDNTPRKPIGKKDLNKIRSKVNLPELE